MGIFDDEPDTLTSLKKRKENFGWERGQYGPITEEEFYKNSERTITETIEKMEKGQLDIFNQPSLGGTNMNKMWKDLTEDKNSLFNNPPIGGTNLMRMLGKLGEDKMSGMALNNNEIETFLNNKQTLDTMDPILKSLNQPNPLDNLQLNIFNNSPIRGTNYERPGLAQDILGNLNIDQQLEKFLEPRQNPLDYLNTGQQLDKKFGLQTEEKPLFGYDFPKDKLQLHIHGVDENMLTHSHFKKHNGEIIETNLNGFETSMLDYILQNSGRKKFKLR